MIRVGHSFDFIQTFKKENRPMNKIKAIQYVSKKSGRESWYHSSQKILDCTIEMLFKTSDAIESTLTSLIDSDKSLETLDGWWFFYSRIPAAAKL